MSKDLNRLFSPKSLAVVGGGAWCASVIDQARRFGFRGEIWPVHPKAREISGLAVAPSVTDLPSAPDAVFVGINRSATIDTVADLSAMGAGGAVCFASGFSEAEAEDAKSGDLQTDLVKAAANMPILGPNCYGFVNALDDVAVWPDQHGMRHVENGVAVLTQSSNIAINLTMQKRALPLAYMVTCGNQAQTGQAEMAAVLLEDPRVTVLGLHIEGFGSLRDWEALAAKAADRNVPLVALKMGRSVQARQATISHTASLAGSDAGAQAVLDRLGIVRVDDIPAFLETLKLMHVTGRLSSNRISSISCSGGEASLVADMCVGRHLTLPPLTSDQKTTLRTALGPMVALANPLDYHTYIWRDADAMTRAWSGMARDDVGITFSVVDYPHTDHSDWTCATQAALGVRAATGRPFAVVSTLPELMPEEVAETLMAGGVVPFSGLAEALTAIERAAQAMPTAEAPILLPGNADATVTLTEAAAKPALAAFGLDVPRSTVVETGATPKGLDGVSGPFAVKGQGIAHKSEAGAVLLNVSPDGLEAAIASVGTSEVLVEEMVTGGVAELLVGVTRDAAHGFVLTLAAGGVWTELLKDSVSLLIPASEASVDAALDRLKIAPLLNGYRGQPAADRSAILAAVLAVQEYVTAHADHLNEVEINPLICTPDRAVAADALIRQGETS